MTTGPIARGRRGVWSRVRRRAAELRDEVHVAALAARDPRTGRLPRLVVGLVVAYVLSPIDPIPDFLPVIGLLDELVVVPLGLALAIRLIPPAVLADARERYAAGDRITTRLGIAVVVILWLAAVLAAGSIVSRLR